ncbi:MAG: mechanosensitive ion channel, partial [Candidatus Desulforudis sp.]|nr:mechanosensitive ion channel [Desulforudis sp.]
MDITQVIQTLQENGRYTAFLNSVLQAALIVAATWLLIFLGQKVIRRVFSVGRSDPQKKETLVSLLSSVLRYVLFAVSALLIIQAFAPGFNIAPILAGAGVVGLAVGFGAQTLIRDVITGFFL